MAGVATGCVIAALGVAACGSGDDTTTNAAGTVKFKLEQPSVPLADEGTSTGIRLIRDGEDAYSGDFWDLPKGRENEATGTTTYGLDKFTLDTGDYAIAAVVRTCPASGCSDESLGAPSTHCHAHFQVHANEGTTLAVVVRGLGRRCRFAVG